MNIAERIAQLNAELEMLLTAQDEIDGCLAQIVELEAEIVRLKAPLEPIPLPLPTPVPPPSGDVLLFATNFDPGVTLSAPRDFWTGNPAGAWVDLLGLPAIPWGGSARIQAIIGPAVTSTTFNAFQENRIEPVTGSGFEGRALFSQVKQQFPSVWSQNTLMLRPASPVTDFYVRFWMMLQADLVAKLQPGVGNWRAVWEWKSAGDYRIIANIATWGEKVPYWIIQADTFANGGLPEQKFWQVNNKTALVPVGRWFKFEAFTHRSSGADGRFWCAVDGVTLTDRAGKNVGVNNAPINRIMWPTYSDAAAPVSQWLSGIEVWDRFPADASAH